MRRMHNTYYFVTRHGPQISIFCLEFSDGDLMLTMVFTAGPVQREPYVVELRAIALREGIIGFLSCPGSSVIVGLVGAFFSMQQAVNCWCAQELCLADRRWFDSTHLVLSDLRERSDSRIV